MANSKEITLNGKTFTLLPVPLAGLKKIGPNLDKIGKETSAEAIDSLIDAIYYGVKRSHPDVTREFFEMNIDSLNVRQLTADFAEVNTPPKQEDAPGEA